MHKPGPIHRDLIVSIFLIGITVAVFWPVGKYGFINLDDIQYVTANPHVATGISSENVRWAFTTFYASNWHPLTWISHMLDCQVFGLKPGLHHLVNLFFHVANTLLLFFIFRRMTGGLWQSAFVAVLFAVHPLHVESVAWVSERKDVLSTFFFMLTMGVYIIYVEKRDMKIYLLAIFFFAMGLLAKPMVVTLPFVLFLLDYWPLRRFRLNLPLTADNRAEKSSRGSKKKEYMTDEMKRAHASKAQRDIRHRPLTQILIEKIPFIILSSASSVITYVAQESSGASALHGFPLSTRIANALVSYCSYIWKAVWPSGLAVLYPYPGMPPAWEIVGAVIFLAVTTFLIVRVAKTHPYLATGWLWFIGTLVPVIGVVQVGYQSMADRYTYIPMIGIFIAIVWAVQDIAGRLRLPRAILPALAACVTAALMMVSFFQVRYWQNSITLFAHTLAVTKNNAVIEADMGGSLLERGMFAEAIPHLEAALKIAPDNLDTQYNLANALARQGRLEKAISYYDGILRVRPDEAAVHNNLGIALAQLGRMSEAVSHFREAVRIRPDFPEARANLGKALAR
ncbi:MAG TPA: tetratricopeptide repeat protein [Syntrophales bacterium]|nr:tetratricopeptide repeat protein [Syntrophales bacterium]